MRDINKEVVIAEEIFTNDNPVRNTKHKYLKFINTKLFCVEASNFLRHGYYTSAPYGSKDYNDYWDEQELRCLNGYEIGGVRITGRHYFYLNFGRIRAIPFNYETGLISGVRKIETFPRFLDMDYYLFHELEECLAEGPYTGGMIKGFICLKSRRKGFSYKMANGLYAYNYNFIPDSFNVLSAFEKSHYDETLNMIWLTINHLNKSTDWAKKRSVVDKRDNFRASFKTKDGAGNDYEDGYKSEVMTISFKDNPFKSIGRSCTMFGAEEAGKFSNLLNTFTIAEPTWRDGDINTGFPCIWGTSGDMESGTRDLYQMFYNPAAYGLKSYENIYDENSVGDCGWFIDDLWYYMGNKDSKKSNVDSNESESLVDKDGNSQRDDARINLFEKRKLRLKGDKNAYHKMLTQQPLTLSEAFLSSGETIWDVAKCQARLQQIMMDKKKYIDTIYYWDFEINTQTNQVECKPKDLSKINPLHEFPLRDNKNKPGEVEIYEMPVRNGDGVIPQGRYIAGCLTPGEMVLTDSGLMKVEEVSLDNKLINQDGKLVDIFNLQRYEVVNEDIYELKVGNTFRTTKFTKEHPILISKPIMGYVSKAKRKRLDIAQSYYKFDFKYSKVENVNTGDWVKAPNIYKDSCIDQQLANSLWSDDGFRIDRCVQNPILDKDFWWFIGLWLGDGWCESDGYKISIAFNSKEVYYINKYTALVSRLFGRDISIVERPGSYIHTFCFQQLSRFLSDNFGKYAIGKKIPEWAKYIDDDFKTSLIHGYLSSDGCIGKHPKGFSITNFVSINLGLLESIQDILFSLGIISSLQKLRDAKKDQLMPDGRFCDTKECYQLRIAHYDTLKLNRLINDSCDIKLSRVNDSLEMNGRRPKMGCYFSDDLKYIYFRVSEVSQSKYTGTVYNFECDTHTFMCHHIATHNCDSYDQDTSTTNSVGSFWILDTITDRLVCHYKGRPKADTFYETCRRLLLLYKAVANYERFNLGIYTYLYNKNCLYLLCDEPSILAERGIASGTTGNTKKGTAPSDKVNGLALELTEKYFSSKAYGYDEGSEMTNYDIIRSIPLLKELQYWNDRPDSNFDDISALGMLMIYRESRAKSIIRTQEKVRSLAQDPYWDKFNARFSEQSGSHYSQSYK